MRRHFFLHALPLRWQGLRAELAAGLGQQFAHPDLFGPVVFLVEILGAALPAGGRSQPRPAAGLITGALIEVRIDKRFGQRQRMVPALDPVGREPREHELHKPADEIGTVAGGQHQQAGVVDQQRQARAPLLVSPADEAVARLEMERGGVPGGQRQPLTAILGHVAQMFADQMAVFQIVMLGEELIEALDLVGRHESHGQMDENLLFIGGGLTKAVGFFLFHARQGKKLPPGCPAKSFSPLFARDLPLRKNAP